MAEQRSVEDKTPVAILAHALEEIASIASDRLQTNAGGERDALKEIEERVATALSDARGVGYRVSALHTDLLPLFREQSLANGFHGMARVAESGEPLQPWQWERMGTTYVRLKDLVYLLAESDAT